MVLGKIIEIYQDTSKVQLFSYESSKTSILLGENRLLLLAEGEGGQNFSVEFPADVLVSEGDVALLEDRPGSILSVVQKIISTPGGLISEAILTSPVNINELRFVEVALGSNATVNEEEL
jgi:cell shape-determining protein MreC